jgi:hypothetical protein
MLSHRQLGFEITDSFWHRQTFSAGVNFFFRRMFHCVSSRRCSGRQGGLGARDRTAKIRPLIWPSRMLAPWEGLEAGRSVRCLQPPVGAAGLRRGWQGDNGSLVIRLAFNPAAFVAIGQTLPVGTVGLEPEVNAQGERLIGREAVDQLRVLRDEAVHILTPFGDRTAAQEGLHIPGRRCR